MKLCPPLFFLNPFSWLPLLLWLPLPVPPFLELIPALFFSARAPWWLRALLGCARSLNGPIQTHSLDTIWESHHHSPLESPLTPIPWTLAFIYPLVPSPGMDLLPLTFHMSQLEHYFPNTCSSAHTPVSVSGMLFPQPPTLDTQVLEKTPQHLCITMLHSSSSLECNVKRIKLQHPEPAISQ